MLCQRCGKNEANVRYTQIINGVKKEISVCEECARKLGIGEFEFNMPIHFSDFLGDFFNDYDTELLPSFLKESQMCENCGETYDEFIKTGLLGCPKCYETFEDRLDPVLRKLQGNAKHVGRGLNKLDKKINQVKQNIKEKTETEKNDNKELSKEEKITQLEDNLKQAIKDERYEDAAKIRDEIKNLREGK